MIGFLLLGRVAHKLAYYAVAILPFALVFFLCRDYFPGWPTLGTFAVGVVALILSFLLGFFLEACMGLVGFWWLEVSSLLFVYMLFSFFLSGHMFPLDMLPQPWRSLVELTPLQYLAYFPAAVLLGKIEGAALVSGLLIEAAWSYRFPARISREQLLRQESLARPIRDTAWKAQERLCRRYRKLARAGKLPTVVTAAIARELSGFVWAIAKLVPPPRG